MNGSDMGGFVREKMGGLGTWFGEVFDFIIHDPMWAGATVAILFLILMVGLSRQRAR